MILVTEMAIKTMISNLKMAKLTSSRGINKYICIVMAHISRLTMMQSQKIPICNKNSTSTFTILKPGTYFFS